MDESRLRIAHAVLLAQDRIGRHRSWRCPNEEHCREDRCECNYPDPGSAYLPKFHFLTLFTRIWLDLR